MSLAGRLRGTPALHLADQVLSSGTNLLGVVVVARRATPQQFGVFSIFLVTFFVVAGFNRAVPHAVAMTLDWDDERARAGSFFLPALLLGAAGSVALALTFSVVDARLLVLAPLLVPMLVQDAGRMHAFAVQRPVVAVVSDGAWLVAAAAGLLVTTTAAGAAVAWVLGALAGLVVLRPWALRLRRARRWTTSSLVSAAIEYGAFAGLGYLTPLLAAPIISVAGVGALQGTNVIRGPIILVVQGLIIHRMAGPPITATACVREALRLSAAVLGAAVACIVPMILLRDVYGPRLLGATWPGVEPLVVPALVMAAIAALAFGPVTVVRKMGRFSLSAMLQLALCPFFLVLPLAGAALAGTRGFLYATAVAHAVSVALWWTVLHRVGSSGAALRPDPALA